MKTQQSTQRYPLSLKGASGGTGIQFFSTPDLATQLKKMAQDFQDAKTELETEKKNFGEAKEETQKNYDEIKKSLEDMEKKINKSFASNNRVNEPGGLTDEQKQKQELESKSFYKFLRKGYEGLIGEERKALVEDDEGRIIVPEELDREIERQLPKITIFRQLVNIRQTSSDRIRKRGLNELTVGWGDLETGPQVLSNFESSLKASERYIYVENLNGLTKIGLDELEDTDVQLEKYLGSSFALAAASAEDTAVLIGKGHAENEPEGILTNTKIPRAETVAAGAVTADDLITLFYKVPSQYRKNGVFVLPSYLEQTIRKFKNANGDYIWQAALTQGTPNQLLGRPVYTQDDFEKLEAGAEVALFGDFKQGYTLVDRMGSSIQRLNELFIQSDLIGFKYKKRVGGGVDKPDAFAILKVKATA